MKNFDQRGFGVPLILIVIVMAITVCGAWYVWNTSKTARPSLLEAKICADGRGPVTSSDGINSYYVCLPDGWVLSEIQGLGVLYAQKNSDLTLQPGKPGVIRNNSGSGAQRALQMSLVGDVQLYVKGDKSTFTTKTRLAAEKYVYKYTRDESKDTIPDSTSVGTTAYTYLVRSKGKVLRVDYHLASGEKSNLEAVESMVNSIEM